MIHRHLSIATVAALCRGGGAFLFLLILARLWGVELFGQFIYAFTLANILGLLVDYGFQIKTLTDLTFADARISKIMGRMLAVKILFSVVLITITASVILFNTDSTWLPTSTLPLLAAYSLNSVTMVLYAPFKQGGKYGEDARTALIDSILTVGLAAFALYFDLGVIQVSWLLFTIKLLIVIGATIEYSKHFSFLSINLYDIFDEIRAGAVFAGHTIIGALYLNIDAFIVRFYTDYYSFGIYQAGMRLVIGAGVLLTVVNAVFTPRFGNQLHRGRHVIQRELALIGGICIFGTLLVCVLLWQWGADVAIFLYGSAFKLLGDLLWIFAAILGMRLFGGFFGVLLSLVGKQSVRLLTGFISLVVIVVADIFLVPQYGILAAAFVLLFVHVAILLIYIFTYYKSDYWYYENGKEV